MKFIFVFMPIASVWLLSAWENGAGSWAAWTSFALMLLWGVMCEMLGKRNKAEDKNM